MKTTYFASSILLSNKLPAESKYSLDTFNTNATLRSKLAFLTLEPELWHSKIDAAAKIFVLFPDDNKVSANI